MRAVPLQTPIIVAVRSSSIRLYRDLDVTSRMGGRRLHIDLVAKKIAAV
jgi:hypothetical protein